MERLLPNGPSDRARAVWLSYLTGHAARVAGLRGDPAGEIRITRELRISPSDLAELIVSLGGVKFWVVAIFPLYIGWVIAQPPGSRHLYIDDLPAVLAILIVGPFLGTFTLLLNVYYDMSTTDRANPRKKYVQVVEELIGEGVMDRETIFLASWAFAAIGLLLAAYVSGNLVVFGAAATGPITSLVGPYAFLVFTFLLAGLSVAYSHPRVRWKGVAGADILTNMVGFGVLCPLAGWSLLRPIEEVPLWFVATLALFIGALYAPTTASDHAADKAFGIRTMAVRLGVGRALAFGFALEVASVALLALGWSQRWFPFEPAAYDAMGPLWPFLLLAIVFYAVFMRRPTVGKEWALVLVLSLAQGFGVLLMLWGFVGGRTLAH